MPKNPFDLKTEIEKWRHQMKAAGLKSPAHLAELESHLREDIDRLMKLGLTESEAFAASTHSIGQSEAITNEFKKVEAGRTGRAHELFSALLASLTGVVAMCAVRKINFTAGTLLGLGLGFSVLLAQIKSGILNSTMLKRTRSFALITNFLLGAILTGPTIASQAAMAAILQLFFECSIWIARYWERRNSPARA